MYLTLSIMWTIWRERNQRTFKGVEYSIVELKRFFLLSLYDWMAASSGHSAFSLVEFSRFLKL
jgi:hypothetical protein